MGVLSVVFLLNGTLAFEIFRNPSAVVLFSLPNLSFLGTSADFGEDVGGGVNAPNKTFLD